MARRGRGRGSEGVKTVDVKVPAALVKGAGKGSGRAQVRPAQIAGKPVAVNAGKSRAPIAKQGRVVSTTVPAAGGAAKAVGNRHRRGGKTGGPGPVKQAAGKERKPVKKGAAKRGSAPKKVGLLDIAVEVDEIERYSGECTFFDKRRGFGFIKPDVEGVVPDDKVMVHWGEITSSDKWPSLTKGQAVEFNLKKVEVKSGTGAIIRAVGVTLAGGEVVALDGELELAREAVGNRNERHSGKIKFYDAKKGFGYVVLDVPVDGVDEAKVTREEVLGGEAIPLAPNLAIEFGLYRNDKGVACTCDVSMPGGEQISRDVAEARQYLGNKKYTGTVEWYAIKKGLGFIIPDNFTQLPKTAQQRSTESAQRVADKSKKEAFEGLVFQRRDKADPASRFTAGSRVSFTVFVDPRNAGATNVAEV
mmetsp:Transcript_58507/g.128275  ORF Transcript_58507/g.128275 Transcript_58507/m.128275 type:complete len:417 (-) Transcript_58507:200-1450(-)|eukprot:CAMPEP_0204391734 /NCGR_PEP_ID=MMETSP0469-20131031/61398_1 /ASSEMBLY_ACC=CAM_ASM_000384 /TAXON_ID=2969 /ORGANISM="Oxyrrhis marina" /LENGTH=416 /DNA_ID=CAMNT_0051385695 /DNA_START=45 /DNA_END=1295 /DNA_ORIENTATION=-